MDFQMPQFYTSNFFSKGKLSVVMDGGAGSSGKGAIGSFLAAHADNWQFCCNAFSAQAGHWVRLNDGRKFFYQTFNSCTYMHDRFEKMYIGPGACIELEALWREMAENRLPADKLGIHPLVAIIQEKDAAYERGEVNFEGEETRPHHGTMKHGSTTHGVGACRARRVLRRDDVVLAKDVPELRPFLCDVTAEIMERLDRGQAGLMEIAQGYQLSLYNSNMYPHVTSRTVTVAGALDEMNLPITTVGNVLINFRTYPIRINNNKYLDIAGEHLTWEQVLDYHKSGKKVITIEGNSGPGYPDQQEVTWDEVTKWSGSPYYLMEITSVTKLPRRVFTFSQQNLRESILQNRTYGRTFICINFMNYVDWSMSEVKGVGEDLVTPKVRKWLVDNVMPVITSLGGRAELRYLGTGPHTDDKIVLTDFNSDFEENS